MRSGNIFIKRIFENRFETIVGRANFLLKTYKPEALPKMPRCKPLFPWRMQQRKRERMMKVTRVVLEKGDSVPT